MKRIKIIAIYLFFILLIVLSVIYIINFFLLKKEATEESNLLNTIEINEEEVTKTETERMLQVKKLQEENPDIIGWLEIEGTKINYPVLQSSDNKYYLNHNYRKKETELGSIFLDCNYDFDIPSSNLLIYGHNTQNGEMFQNYEFPAHSTMRLRRTVNSDPSPGALRTQIVPPEMSSTRLASASPSPLPSPL